MLKYAAYDPLRLVNQQDGRDKNSSDFPLVQSASICKSQPVAAVVATATAIDTEIF